jgi:hypothetical protein
MAKTNCMWMVSIKVGHGGFDSGLTYSCCNYRTSLGAFASTPEKAIAAALKMHRTGEGTKRKNDTVRKDMLRRIESGESFTIECTTMLPQAKSRFAASDAKRFPGLFKAKGAAVGKAHKRDPLAR